MIDTASSQPEPRHSQAPGLRMRRMTLSDMPELMRLKTMAQWNQVEADWQLLLEHNPNGCLVMTDAERLVGTVTTINYKSCISWIGMVLVDPEFRRRGIATCLMEKAVATVSGCASVKLDATPDGKKVYENLGFVDEMSIRRMVAPTGVTGFLASGGAVESVAIQDLPELARLDREAFGAHRHRLLQALYQRRPGYAFKICRDGGSTGFCLGRDGVNFDQIGPVVAATTEDALLLLGRAVEASRGRALVVDVPEMQTEWSHCLSRVGFVEQRSFLRMRRGASLPADKSETLHAIAGPELG